MVCALEKACWSRRTARKPPISRPADGCEGVWRGRRPRVLIEEAISGPEISVIVLTDGKQIVRLAPARDYKRVNDGDAGPNTGGMGAISSDELLPHESGGADSGRTIVEPTIRGMAEDGRPYSGFLYFG